MSDWAKISVLEPLVDRFSIDLEEGTHIVDPGEARACLVVYNDEHLELHIEGEGPAHIVSCDWDEWSRIALDYAPSFVLDAIKGSEF